MDKLHNVINIVMAAAWVVLFLTLAVVAFFRLRKTVSGILLGVTFALMGFSELFLAIAYRTFLKELLSGGNRAEAVNTAINLGTDAVYILFYLVIVVGVLLIPRSLKKLHS